MGNFWSSECSLRRELRPNVIELVQIMPNRRQTERRVKLA